MCYICSCFAWGIDFLQRAITFGLACILSGAICFGMAIAIMAGIAYGYHYSMAEWLTFTRSDVTVYMRRGKFLEKPVFPEPSMTRTGRRSNEIDLFTSNATMDYEDQKPAPESKPLADTWLKNQDTRKYAEILTRYSPNKRSDSDDSFPPAPARMDSRNWMMASEATLPPIPFKVPEAPVISIMANPLLPTVSWRSGSSEIVMRNYKPMQDFTVGNQVTKDMPATLFPPPEGPPRSIAILSPKEKAKGSSDAKLRDDFHKNYVPMRVWGTTPRPVIIDSATEDVDEDNIVYKPV